MWISDILSQYRCYIWRDFLRSFLYADVSKSLQNLVNHRSWAHWHGSLGNHASFWTDLHRIFQWDCQSNYLMINGYAWIPKEYNISLICRSAWSHFESGDCTVILELDLNNLLLFEVNFQCTCSYSCKGYCLNLGQITTEMELDSSSVFGSENILSRKFKHGIFINSRLSYIAVYW